MLNPVEFDNLSRVSATLLRWIDLKIDLKLYILFGM